MDDSFKFTFDVIFWKAWVRDSSRGFYNKSSARSLVHGGGVCSTFET